MTEGDRGRVRPLSRALLRLVRRLEDEGLDVKWATEVVKEYLKDDPLPVDDRRETVAHRNEIRALLALTAKARLAPTSDNMQIDLALLDRSCDDDALDYYFTMRLLGDIRSISSRLRSLRPLTMDRLPDRRIHHYMEQASTAYLYGLFEACRAGRPHTKAR
ncbi:MAG: hypothetical protein FJ027_08535 [Candidatus Rokubacteria bacterium]|nr:hypothetical protein [Candidatus Rokubacteria bacterium]